MRHLTLSKIFTLVALVGFLVPNSGLAGNIEIKVDGSKFTSDQIQQMSNNQDSQKRCDNLRSELSAAQKTLKEDLAKAGLTSSQVEKEIDTCKLCNAEASSSNDCFAKVKYGEGGHFSPELGKACPAISPEVKKEFEEEMEKLTEKRKTLRNDIDDRKNELNEMQSKILLETKKAQVEIQNALEKKEAAKRKLGLDKQDAYEKLSDALQSMEENIAEINNKIGAIPLQKQMAIQEVDEKIDELDDALRACTHDLLDKEKAALMAAINSGRNSTGGLGGVLNTHGHGSESKYNKLYTSREATCKKRMGYSSKKTRLEQRLTTTLNSIEKSRNQLMQQAQQLIYKMEELRAKTQLKLEQQFTAALIDIEQDFVKAQNTINVAQQEAIAELSSKNAQTIQLRMKEDQSELDSLEDYGTSKLTSVLKGTNSSVGQALGSYDDVKKIQDKVNSDCNGPTPPTPAPITPAPVETVK